MLIDGRFRHTPPRRGTRGAERGFTLLETVIALLIMMVAGLGAAALFAYAINNNSGAHNRDVIVALAQHRLEQIRSATFNALTTDAVLAGGTTTANFDAAGTTPCPAGARCFILDTAVDDDPADPDIDVVNATTLKRISVTVTARTAGPQWAAGNTGAVTFHTFRSRAH